MSLISGSSNSTVNNFLGKFLTASGPVPSPLVNHTAEAPVQSMTGWTVTQSPETRIFSSANSIISSSLRWSPSTDIVCRRQIQHDCYYPSSKSPESLLITNQWAECSPWADLRSGAWADWAQLSCKNQDSAASKGNHEHTSRHGEDLS